MDVRHAHAQLINDYRIFRFTGKWTKAGVPVAVIESTAQVGGNGVEVMRATSMGLN